MFIVGSPYIKGFLLWISSNSSQETLESICVVLIPSCWLTRVDDSGVAVRLAGLWGAAHRTVFVGVLSAGTRDVPPIDHTLNLHMKASSAS